MPTINDFSSGFKNSEISAAIDFESDYNPFDTPKTLRERPATNTYNPYTPPKQDYKALFEQSNIQEDAVTQFIIAKKYICTQTNNGFILTNIHRAQSRILYEQMLAAIRNEKPVCQTALFPIQIQIAPSLIPLIEEHAELLDKLGFSIRIFGTNTIIIEGLPEGYNFDESTVRSVVADLLQILEDEHHSLPEIMQSDIAKRLSELKVSRDIPLTQLAMKSLIERLKLCDNSEYTPSGKRISKLITIDDIEKLF